MPVLRGAESRKWHGGGVFQGAPQVLHANSLEAFVLAATVVVVNAVGVIPAWCDSTAALQQAVVVGALRASVVRASMPHL